MKLTVDKEFHALIPPLAQQERDQLEQNILAEGCRDPLMVWYGPEYQQTHCKECAKDVIPVPGDGNWECPACGFGVLADEPTLLDGHNRFEICEAHGLEFETKEVELPDRDAAKVWIMDNQLGRRNLTRDQFGLLLGQRYNLEKKAIGVRGKQKLDQNDPSSTAERLGRQHGVGQATVKRHAADAEWLEGRPEDLKAVRDRKTTLLEVKRAAREETREERREDNRTKIADAPDLLLAGAKFATIMIDPPWDWGDEGDVDQLGRARPTYGTMPYEKLLELPVADLADEDCHLYLWITNRSLPKGFGLLDAWGFRYITCLTWCKPSYGMGNYFRGQTEHILFGVKGSQPLKRKDAGTWFQAPRGEAHSSKPNEFYSIVESCSPGPYLEMFARAERKGWTGWGAEA